MTNSQLEERFHRVDRVPSPWDEPAAAANGPTGTHPLAEVVPHRGPARRASGRRLAASVGVAAALVLGMVLMISAVGGWGGEAYAVTQNSDGTVTVEISSIQDSDGLEQQLEAAGVPAGVHFLPTGKLCNPRGQGDGSTPIDDRWAELEHPRLAITATEDGAFTFTVDRSRLLPAFALLVTMEYAPPEHGQPGASVPSIMAEYTSNNVDQCDLVDGTVEGWFQAGAG